MHGDPASRSSLPSPGWYADPWGSAEQRWWDGEKWTGVVIPLPLPSRTSRRKRVLIGAIALAWAAMSGFGLLAMMGFFDEPSLARVVSIQPNGDICIRADGRSRVTCVPDAKGVRVEPGDCVLVFYGEGVRLDRRIECPPDARSRP